MFLVFISLASLAQIVERDGEGFIVPKDEEGNPSVTLQTVFVVGSTKRRVSDSESSIEFSRLRYNIIKLLPYANEAARRMKIIEAELAKMTDPKARKKYLDIEEKKLFGDYEDDMRDLSLNQGRLLIKLVHRQTDARAFDIIKEMKGGTSAFIWQGVARIFGTNLKTEYDPQQDSDIEAVIQSLYDTQYFKKG